VQGLVQVETVGTYVLQAGSFKSFQEADRLKASLVLLGIEANIQTVTVNNKDTWHRVHIGPYKELAELNRIRARLRQNNIDTVLLKIKS
jgi:cell division protein FtsN